MNVALGNLMLFLFVLTGCTSYEEQVLFEFEEREAWFRDGTANWNWNDGEIIGESGSGSSFLMTNESYENFELSLEFYPDSTVNSGIFIRCSTNEISATDCYEFNIWDLHPNQDYRTGALVGKAKPMAMVQTLNQWNTYLIKAQKGILEAWVNDQQTVSFMDNNLSKGYIAIQAGASGTIRFRNIKIKYVSN